MTAIATTVKNAVKTKLDALKTAGTLKTVVVDDFKTDAISEKDIPAFPAAVLSSPACDGETEDNRDNTRIYTFEIMIVQKGENISSANDIEELAEAILDSFDNDPTLGGAAQGGVAPAASSTPVTNGEKNYIAFTVTLKIKSLKSLTF